MAHLTEDMTRLVAEIYGHHLDRNRLMRDVRHAAADLRRTVAQTVSGSRAARIARMSEQQKRLRGFALNLKETVGGMRAAFHDDLAGAHRAWFGGSKTVTKNTREGGRERSRAKA
jgi:hypothetical protein